MSEQELSEERTGQLLEEAAQEIPANLDLWPAIQSRLQANQATSLPPVSFEQAQQPQPNSNRPTPVKKWRNFTLAGLGLAAALAIALIAVPVLVLFNSGKSGAVTPGANSSTLPAATSTVTVARPVTGTVVATLSGYDAAVRSLTWSPDGKVLASGTDGQMVKLWTADGKPVATISDFKQGVYSLRWSPDGTLSTGDGRTWDAQGKYQGPLILNLGGQTPENQSQTIYVSSWSPDGKILALSTGKSNEIRLQRQDGTLLGTLSIPEGILGNIAWSPDGKTLATGGQNVAQAGPSNIRLWIWRTDGSLVATIEDFYYPITGMAWSPDGKVLAASAKGENKARLISADGKILAELPGKFVVWDLAWSPDGKYLAAACSDNMVRIWSPTGKLLATLGGHSDEVWAVAWSRDGILASGSGDKTVKLWKITF
jgi:WD40 repeat protein